MALCYVRRLALSAPASAHVATSSVQLVAGLRDYCPGWQRSRHPFTDRDAHHTSLRRFLKTSEPRWHRGFQRLARPSAARPGGGAPLTHDGD